MVYGTGVRVRWSRDGGLLFITLSEQTSVVPVPRGQPLPKMPPTGFASAADVAALPGVMLIDANDPSPRPARPLMHVNARSSAPAKPARL
jgi:hypothetical protein